jgi:DNA (cytosine-5)-methyltransferase 1
VKLVPFDRVPRLVEPPINQWVCEDTVRELRGLPPRVLPTRPVPSGVQFTWLDGLAGAGGSTGGIHQVPGQHVQMAINHWPLAVETHNHNFPLTDHDVANIARPDPRRYPRTDLAWFSPECFPAGTTVLTARGVIPIEQVRVGDLVLTHRLRWQPVTAVMRKTAPTIKVTGYGHPGIEVTADHPFYVRTAAREWNNDRRAYGRVVRDHPAWVRAGDLVPRPVGQNNRRPESHMWASPLAYPHVLPIPAVGGRGMDQTREDFWWLVGRWLGDGSVRLRDRSSEVTIACGNHEADELEARLKAWAPTGERAGHDELRWRRRRVRTATLFETGFDEFARWLVEHFGRHASGKRMPAWALTMPEAYRRALLDGYASADGQLAEMSEQRPVIACTTISRPLAVGVRLLALSLGFKVSMTVGKRTAGVIEGRPVKMRPLWQVRWCIDPSPAHDQTVAEDGLRWSPVTAVSAGREQVEVFNLSVAEDESYVADGLIVHNCTHWSIARGEKVDYDSEWEQPALDAVLEDEDDTPAAKEARWRSRMLMSDVIRFSAVHRYRGVIVENVPDILRWWAFDRWLAEMHKLGYRSKVIHLNSAFAMALGAPAPQLRNRVYIVFWQKRYRTPNWRKWLSPLAWCPTCREVVRGVYSPKPGPRRPMLYGVRHQYVYRCPNTSCRHAIVQPYVLPALAAIDFSLPAQRIGDRKRPLQPATRARIEAGLRRYATRPVAPVSSPSVCPPLLVPAGGSRRSRGDRGAAPATVPMATRDLDEPLATVVADGSSGNALVVPVEARDGQTARPVTQPLRTQTGRHQDALVVPLRRHAVPTQASEHPLVTLAAGGTHHALVMRNMTARGDQGQMCTPVIEPLRTFLAEGGKQSLIQLPGDGHLLYSYDSGALRPLVEPLATQTTVEGEALVGQLAVDVDDCTLRMLAVHEIQAGMAFPDGFRWLESAKRDRVRMLGNAVTPPAARDLAAALVEAISEEEIELTGWAGC